MVEAAQDFGDAFLPRGCGGGTFPVSS